MKQIIFIGLLILSAALSASDKYAVVADASEIYWQGFKPGTTHDGIVKLSSGIVDVKNGQVVGGEFTIDFNSIVNYDVKDDGWKEKLVGHLKSEDFFYTEKYPYGKFVITTVEKISGNNYKVTGNLTARGNTHEVIFNSSITLNGTVIEVETDNIELDRTKWDLKYNSKKFNADLLKDRIIDDKMVVKISLKAKAE